MSYLLDTCVISKLRNIKKRREPKLENWIAQHDESSYFLSVLTVSEIQAGISKLNMKKSDERERRLVLEDWFFESLLPRFKDRILPIDNETALTWGRLTGECRQRGIIIPVIDGLIASTALTHGLTVVTENVRDFVETGARLFNPWQ